MRFWLRLSVTLLCVLSVSTTYAWRELTLTKTDSLSSLADKYRPSGVTRMDMVIAIRNANPHVFTKGAALKPGTMVMLPMTPAEVRQAAKGKAPAISKAQSVDAATQPDAPKSTPVKPIVAVPTDVPAKPAVVAKSVIVAKKASVDASANSGTANQNAMLIKSLQDTVSNQTQAIQNYQAQINQLNGELNLVNQQIKSLQVPSANTHIWNLGDVWLALWVLTLGAFFWQYRKCKALGMQLTHQPQEVAEEVVVAEPMVEESVYQGHVSEAVAEDEVDEDDVDVIEDEPADEQEEALVFEMQAEPKFIEPQIAQPKSLSENWEQVELDIPMLREGDDADAAGTQDKHEDRALRDGEYQEDFIDVLVNDENNMEWHRALLEFYVKTNSQNGFKRHYQNMVRSGMMLEGDPLWEDVRKMYLNKWIYQAI